jgi:hypothetical protein
MRRQWKERPSHLRCEFLERAYRAETWRLAGLKGIGGFGLKFFDRARRLRGRLAG